MEIRVVGRSLEVTDALRQQAEKHLQSLVKVGHEPRLVLVELIEHLHKKHGNKFEIKIVWATLSKSFTMSAKGEDMYKLIIEASHKLGAQLGKEHSKSSR